MEAVSALGPSLLSCLTPSGDRSSARRNHCSSLPSLCLLLPVTVAFPQALASHLESRQHMDPGSSAHQAAGPEVLILVLCDIPVSSTFSHALCPALLTPGAVGMGDAAAVGGGGSAPGLQVTSNQPQIPVATFSTFIIQPCSVATGRRMRPSSVSEIQTPRRATLWTITLAWEDRAQRALVLLTQKGHGSLPGVADGPTLVH